MLDNKDSKQLQSLYPEPQSRYGMDARAPTKFNVPVITLSLLLFLPLYAAIAFISLYLYGSKLTEAPFEVSAAALYIGLVVVSAIGLGLLARARTIIVRNCSNPQLIQTLYGLVIVASALLLLYKFGDWFDGSTVVYALGVEAAGIYAIVLVLVLFARGFNRSRLV